MKDLDFSSSTAKVLFHFPKMHVKFDEWIEVGSPRICALGTMVMHKKEQVIAKKTNSKVEMMNNDSSSSRGGGDSLTNEGPSDFASPSPPRVENTKDNDIDISASPNANDKVLSNSSGHTLNIAELSEAVPLPECDSPMLCKSERIVTVQPTSTLGFPSSLGGHRFSGQRENNNYDQMRQRSTEIYSGIDLTQQAHMSNHTIPGTILDNCTPFALRQNNVNPKVVTREECNRTCPPQSIAEYQATQSQSSNIRNSFYNNFHQWNGQTHNTNAFQVSQTLSPRGQFQGYLGFPDSTPSFDQTPRVQESAFDKLLMLASASHGQADVHGAWRGPMPESVSSFAGIASHPQTQVTYNQNGDHINNGLFGNRKQPDSRFFSNHFAG